MIVTSTRVRQVVHTIMIDQTVELCGNTYSYSMLLRYWELKDVNFYQVDIASFLWHTDVDALVQYGVSAVPVIEFGVLGFPRALEQRLPKKILMLGDLAIPTNELEGIPLIKKAYDDYRHIHGLDIEEDDDM